ncbi:MAG: aminotransferase class V-fold PLP-dependent enzyme, partial [Candidatus Micrarchaeota archaeon]
YIEITKEGRLEEEWEKCITPKTRMVCVMHASNVLGTINDVREICETAKGKGCTTVVDGAQAAPHLKVDVKKIGCDFYAFSGHKMLGPMGIGVLYARKELLEKMPPFLGGGDMIRRVERQKAEWNDIPYKFEAGTPNVEGAVGLSAAVDYLNKLGFENIRNHEAKLTKKALEELSRFENIRVLGPLDARERVGAIAFTHSKMHPHDIAAVMDAHSIAIRTGHHCAMPLHLSFGIPASARASFYVYNTLGEIDEFAEALRDVDKRSEKARRGKTEEMYSEQVLRYYEFPPNKGRIKADYSSRADNPLCGDEIEVFLKADGKGKILKASFDGHGCAVSTAGVSMLLEKLEGKSISDAKKTSEKEILKMLGGITPARFKCAFLGLEAVKKALV